MSDSIDTLFGAVQAHAQRSPEALALSGPDGRLNYAGLELAARRLAAGLRAQGIGPGEVVGLQLPNSVEFIVTLLAANFVGATVQMLHMPYRRAELGPLLAHSGATCFIGLSKVRDSSPTGIVRALQADPASGLGALRTLITLGEPVAACVDWSTLARSDPLTGPPAAHADSPYVLLYTSGTTASPKGVPTTARRFLGNAADALSAFGFGPSDVLLSAAPYSHLYGLFVLQNALLAGACASLLPAFTPDDLLATVRRDRVTAIFAGPAHFKPLLDGKAMKRDDFRSTRLVCLSGTHVPPGLARAVESQLDAGKVIQLWGMSELQAGAYGRPGDPADLRHETAGRVALRTELQVVGDANQVLEPGCEGRLRVRGASVFAAYLNNPEATQAAFSDDWFDTGDTALLRPDGALVLTGRVKELINRGGVKFNPVDVEAVLDTVPGVSRCILAPMPDPTLGERACAFVLPNQQHEVTLGDLTAALERAGVAKFKWPERLEFVSEFPMTPTQKVRRSLLTRLITPGAA